MPSKPLVELVRLIRLVDLSSHNTNPPAVFDGDAIPISDVADARLE
jgi:hypothetical protein